MGLARIFRAGALGGLIVALASCGGGSGIGSGGISSGKGLFGSRSQTSARTTASNGPQERLSPHDRSTNTIQSLFAKDTDPNTLVEVNRFIWNAALDVLNFLPVELVDPFSGVIVTGYGTPPGGGRAYRATIYVQDPALDARSLKVALATRSGPVSPATQRAVEDAILTRARQLRIAAGKL